MRRKLWILGGLVFFGMAGSGFIAVRFYSFVFGRTVRGPILHVERLPTSQTTPVTFAVSVRDRDGEIVTASTTDRQWAVAQTGYCAEVRFFRYPPWDYDRAGTYFGARLKKLYECKT